MVLGASNTDFLTFKIFSSVTLDIGKKENLSFPSSNTCYWNANFRLNIKEITTFAFKLQWLSSERTEIKLLIFWEGFYISLTQVASAE